MKVDFYRHSLGAAELASVKHTLESLFLTLGPRVGEFEQRFAELLGVPHVVGTSACTTSLALMLRAFDIGPGDEVVTTPITFAATSNAVLHVGARPVFADVDAATGLLDPTEVERALTPRTRAVIAVHLYGQLADVRALRDVCDRRGLRLFEDAAHAVESERDGVRTGHLADAAAFSFYATKNLASGDGGALAVHDPAIAARLKVLRNHGMSRDAASRHGSSYQHWDMVELGYKAAMTDIEAALLLPQLAGVWDRRDRREALARRYDARLAGHADIVTLPWRGRSAHHLYAVLVPRALRDRVLAGLGERGVGCAVNYNAVHTLGYYRSELGLAPEALPRAWDFGARTLSLPMWPGLSHEQVDYAADALIDAVAAARAAG